MSLSFMLMFFSVVWTASTVWIYCDTNVLGIKRGQHKGFPNFGPYGWFFFTLFVWPVAFPLYIHKRDLLIKLAREARTKAALQEAA